ncbi:MAG: DUF3990 domain-containing protein [Oscillospiraceae bacterium]|jgi:hypothetical protein|nr:DUF3990 domain-containing protein [Oscillospiraceae bacterium]
MILYHGSYTTIEKPDISFSRLRTDFGKGFYLTPLKEQARSWAERFLTNNGTAVISSFLFLNSADDFQSNIKILEFDSHNHEWLEFIMACRLGKPIDSMWDLVIGGIANDKVFDTLQLYFDNLINADEAIGRLKYNKPNLQYCFKTQDLIDDYLQFKNAEVLQ